MSQTIEPTTQDRREALSIVGGYRYRYLDIPGSVAQALRDQRETACAVVCEYCRAGVELGADLRHFDGDAFYTCQARLIRDVLAGRVLREEVGR